jgi:hypothetical protein
MQYLFDKSLDYRTRFRFSFLEIYNENVRDLLSDSQKSLTIIEDPVRGVQAQELKEFAVSKIEEIEELITLGNERRVLAPTTQNQFSSRSHAILILSIDSQQKSSSSSTAVQNQVFCSKLTFIDLAGSEKGTSDKQCKRHINVYLKKISFSLSF